MQTFAVFSSRLPPTLTPNRLSRLRAELEHSGEPIIDLMSTTPSAVGLPHDGAALAEALRQVDLAAYRPDPRGQRRAREAIGAAIGGRYAADDLLLCASTSEAYAFLFKLLCSPGDQVLVPRPSYPLFEHLTRLEGVEAIPYRLHYAGGWQLDLDEVREAMGPRVRAILAVSPNNPTGSYLSAHELAGLCQICGDRAALIVDEVFYEYPLAERPPGPAVAAIDSALVFGLGGLSKLAGLPQLKLAWIGIGGDPRLRHEAVQRLELIADAYLSVNMPVQLAAAALLRQGASWRARAQRRLRGNRRLLERLIRVNAPQCTLLAAEGGWYAVVRVPAIEPEEELALALLREDRVFAHPGYFYDFSREAFFVLSLLAAPEAFERGVERMLTRVAA